MKSFIHFLTLLITVSLGIRTAHAIPITFEAILTGANEVPPVVSPATGQAIVVLDPTAQTIQINATFSGLTTPHQAGHNHFRLPSPFLTGVNAGAATTGPSFVGVPFDGDLRGHHP